MRRGILADSEQVGEDMHVGRASTYVYGEIEFGNVVWGSCISVV
jgi:hypothetical protein